MKSLYRYSFFFYLSIVLFSSCQEKEQTDHRKYLSVTDDVGRAVDLPLHPQKVMALAPSMTEYLALICKKEQLVGRTQNCDFPTWVKGLPEVINYPHLDLELILKLRPDLIVTQKGMTPESDILKLAEFGIPTYVFCVDSLDKVNKSAGRIGEITNNKLRGNFVEDSLRNSKNDIVSEGNVNHTAIGLTSISPFFAFGKGSLVDEMMREVGMINLIDSSFISAYPQIDEEYLLRKNPDIIFVTSTITKEEFFEKYPNLKKLNVYENNAFYRVESNYISRQGPRALMGLSELQKMTIK